MSDNPFASPAVKAALPTTDTRHLNTDQPDPAPAPSPAPFVEHVISVGWDWGRALDRHEGYALYLAQGGYPHTFPEHEWRIIDALPTQLEDRKSASVKVNWRVEWSKAAGIISITDWEDTVQATEKQTLTDVFPRDENNQSVDAPAKPPASKRPADKIGAAIYCRNHVKKHYDVQGKELNVKLKDIFEGKEPEDYLNAFGVEKTYARLDVYDAERVHPEDGTEANGKPTDAKRASTPPEPQNGQAAQTGSNPQGDTQPAKSEPQSAPESGNLILSERRDAIREKYTMDMRGKDYLAVQGRISLFRLEHPDWSIETDIMNITDLSVVFKAIIKNSEGRIVATGHGRATENGTKNLGGRFIEKAETAAIGRALALAGFGTDDSLDDRDYKTVDPAKRRRAMAFYGVRQ